MLEYYWLATYKDGSQFKQFENNQERLFKEIDQARLDTFSWVPFDSSKPSFTLKIQPWQRLIALKTHRISTKTKTGEKIHTITYLLGWQTTINGKNYKSIVFINPDGTVIIGDSLDEKRNDSR